MVRKEGKASNNFILQLKEETRRHELELEAKRKKDECPITLKGVLEAKEKLRFHEVKK